MSHVWKKVGWYLWLAVLGVAIGLGCSSAPSEEDSSEDPTLNAAAGCADEACTKCTNGYTQKKQTDGSNICSNRQTIAMPFLQDVSIVETKSGTKVTSLTADRFHTVKMSTLDIFYGSVTMWAQAIDADATKPPKYLCKLVTVDLDKWDRSQQVKKTDPASGRPVVERVSQPFTLDSNCIEAVGAYTKAGGKIARIGLQYSFDVEGLYDVVNLRARFNATEAKLLWGEVNTWSPREKYTSVKYVPRDAGVTGPVNDAGLVTVVGDPDEAAYLNQRLMKSTHTFIRQENETRNVGGKNTVVPFYVWDYATLKDPPLGDVGTWSSAPQRLGVEATEFTLDSSVLRISPRFVYGVDAYRAAPSASSPQEFGGTFSFSIAGFVPGNTANFALTTATNLYRNLSLGIYMRPVGGSSSDWTSVSQQDGVRTPNWEFPCGSTSCPKTIIYEPPLNVELNAAKKLPPNFARRFDLRANTIVRRKLFTDWYDKTRFEVAACPIVANPYVDRNSSNDANRSNGYFDVASSADDNRCKRTTVSIERLPLGRSGAPPLDPSSNDGATNGRGSGNGQMSTAQSGTNASSCTKVGGGKQKCDLDQSMGVSAGGAFQSNLVNSSLSTESIDDGSKPLVDTPSLEVFGFNLLAGVKGDSQTDTQTGSIKFPVGAWFQSLLNKADSPRPPTGGIEKKNFRPGERAGLAYVLEKAWPPMCGPFGCVQVVVQLFAGGFLDADVIVTPQVTGSANKIPCAKSSDPSRCFVSYPGEGETVNNLTFTQGAKYCAKFGGRLARLRNADEETAAATADSQAVTAWNGVASHASKKVEKKGWVGFEKTMILAYDPATCLDVINNGKPVDGACYNVGAGIFKSAPSNKMSNYYLSKSDCQASCSYAKFPFYGMYVRSPIGNNRNNSQFCGCMDSYNDYGPAGDQNECDQSCDTAGYGNSQSSKCGNFGGTRMSVYSTLSKADQQATLSKCLPNATPAWSYPNDTDSTAILATMDSTGEWNNYSGVFTRLKRNKGTDKYVTLDGTGSTVTWPTVGEDATNHPICEFEKASSVSGVAIGLTFTPSVAAGGSVSIIYGNKYIVGIGVKLTVNLVSLSLPFAAEFNTVSAVRSGNTIITGGSSFGADFNIQFLSGSLGVVLYTAFHDFDFPIFDFSGIQMTFPLFKFEKVWRYN